MGRRTLLLVAALFLAAVGTGVLFFSLRGIAPATRQGSDQVEVLAPAQAIPGGTTITARTPLRGVSVAADVATQGRMIRAGERQSVDGKVANSDLLPFVPLTTSQLGGAVSGKAKIGIDDRTLMAITVDLEDPARVANLLVNGSHVAIWVVDADTKPSSSTHEARLFLNYVKVLTTGTNGTIDTAPSAEAANQDRGSSALVTLQVSQEQAGRLLVAQAAGDLYFTLVTDDKTATEQAYDESAIAAGP